MSKAIKIGSTLLLSICLLGQQLSFSASAATEKKSDCKNNNSLGNNYEFVVVLPTSSLSVDDTSNELLSIRIDPDNRGQMNQLVSSLSEQNFEQEQMDFVTSQIPDLEMRSQIELQCTTDSIVDRDFTVVAFAD